MATRSLNKVMLIGNLTRDPELRYTPQGTAVCSIGLATNRSWSTDTGEKKEDVEYHRLVAWGKLAELCAQLLFKGRKVYFQGRLQTRQWEGQDKVSRSTTEVVVDDMLILDNRQKSDGGSDGGDYSDDYFADDQFGGKDDSGSSNSSDQPSGKEKKATGTKKNDKNNENESDMPF